MLREEKGMPLYRDGLIINCEVCNTPTPMEELHSFSYSYALPGLGKESAAPGCEQHYTCCHEHAMMAHIYCLFKHADKNLNYNHNRDNLPEGRRFSNDLLEFIYTNIDQAISTIRKDHQNG